MRGASKLSNKEVTSWQLLMDTINQGHKGIIAALAFLPNGELIVSRAKHSSTLPCGTLQKLNLSKMEFELSIDTLSSYATYLLPLSDEQVLCAFYDKKMSVWNPLTNVWEQAFNGEIIGKVNAMCALDDGRVAVSSSLKNEDSLWIGDLAANTRQTVPKSELVTSIAQLSNGNIVCSDVAGFIDEWSLVNLKRVHTLTANSINEGKVHSISIVGTLLDDCVVTNCQFLSSDEIDMKVWNLQSGTCVKEWQGEAGKVLFVSENGRAIVTNEIHDARKYIRVWEISGSKQTCVEDIEIKNEITTGKITCWAVAPTGELIIGFENSPSLGMLGTAWKNKLTATVNESEVINPPQAHDSKVGNLSNEVKSGNREHSKKKQAETTCSSSTFSYLAFFPSTPKRNAKIGLALGAILTMVLVHNHSNLSRLGLGLALTLLLYIGGSTLDSQQQQPEKESQNKLKMS